MTILSPALNARLPPIGDSIQATEGRDTLLSPVLQSSFWAFEKTDLVSLNEPGIQAAVKYIYNRLRAEAYTPRTWRTHPLHLLPAEPYSPEDPSTRLCLDWIFLISSLNFSFWSEREGHPDRYGVEWRTGWNSNDRKTHTGYWSLVAAIDRALEEGIPITNPAFYSSEEHCPDELLQNVFRPAAGCSETIPLLRERIAIMRDIGRELCDQYHGSFKGFCDEFMRRYEGRGTALQLVQMVVDTFPSFRDEVWYEGRKIRLWKRAQILVAETWAAFHPASQCSPHPLFPHGSAIGLLTMFADYRVPQILHHLRILAYPPTLEKALRAHQTFAPGCKEEVSIRTASIVAVEKLREGITLLCRQDVDRGDAEGTIDVSSVLIDFFLWDLAKNIESGGENIVGMKTNEMLPAHRTRSIWY